MCTSKYSYMLNDAMDMYDMKFSHILFPLSSILASLNLPAALEDTSGADIPQSVKDKAAAVKTAGGLTDLQNMLQELPELLQRNKDILDEVGMFIYRLFFMS